MSSEAGRCYVTLPGDMGEVGLPELAQFLQVKELSTAAHAVRQAEARLKGDSGFVHRVEQILKRLDSSTQALCLLFIGGSLCYKSMFGKGPGALMATRKPPPKPQPAHLTVDEMRAAIPKLKRRIDELNLFDPASINDRYDPFPASLVRKIDDTLVDILGSDSLDYQRFQVRSLDKAPIVMGGIPIQRVRQGYAEGKSDALSKLQTLIDLLEEKLADSGETQTGRTLRSFSDLDLHPEVKRVVSNLFLDGHYSNAVEDACKVLDLLVRMRSGSDDRSGTDLMQAVFSPNSPVLRFNDLANDSDRSEQQGMMFLYAGVMLAFRNQRAHGLISDDAEKALEIISLISFLAKSLDRAKRYSAGRTVD